MAEISPFLKGINPKLAISVDIISRDLNLHPQECSSTWAAAAAAHTAAAAAAAHTAAAAANASDAL